MKQKGIKKLALFLSLALVLALASGCSTSAGTNAALYFKNMSRILFSGSDSQGGGSTVENTNAPAKTEIASPADFAISDGNYSFTGVENAAQYLIYLCESGSTDDDDDYLYSGVIPASGLDTHSGTISDAVDHAYGTYTAKLFAVAADYTMSAGALAEYSVSGPLPEPELAYSWDGQGTLKLQIANKTAYEYSAMPDSIDILLTDSEGAAQSLSFDSSLGDIEAGELSAGEYTIEAAASSSSSFVTNTSAQGKLSLALGTEEAASENYTAPAQGGHGGWEVKPAKVSFEEGAASFPFSIGEAEFFKTTANLQEAPDEGSTYTYLLAPGDPKAPFESTMKLQIRPDGTAEVSVTEAGPISTGTTPGTWTSADGMITLAW